MATLPPNPVLQASLRWLQQLRHSSPGQARAMFTAHPRYRDLTLTQYEAAFEWLESVGLVANFGKLDDLRLAGALSDEAAILEAAIAHAQPPWVQDADQIIRSPDEFPEDLSAAVEALNLDHNDGLSVVREAWGKVDTAVRKEVGEAGELALVRLLKDCASAEVFHVAAQADGYGFDIVIRKDSERAHLEVKSTLRRGRLAFYLSRNEHEVMLRDPDWHLVVLLLDESRKIAAVGTVDSSGIRDSAPTDVSGECRWQSARLDVSPAMTQPGLTAVIPWAFLGLPDDHILTTGYTSNYYPTWFNPPGRSAN